VVRLCWAGGGGGGSGGGGGGGGGGGWLRCVSLSHRDVGHGHAVLIRLSLRGQIT